MANLPAKTIAQFVQDFAAAAQASANASGVANGQLIDFTTGSIFLALAEASADEGAFLQGLIAYVMTLRWLSSSFGIDVDSWTADWMPGAVGGLVLPSGAVSPRLPAVAATGNVTFTRVSTVAAATMAVGVQVSSLDGSITFTVYADATNGAYVAATNTYNIAAGVATVTVPVKANTAGIIGNVGIGTISLPQSAIPGFDSVTNSAAFVNGLNAETDQGLKARFVLFIGQLSKATEAALGFAILGIQQGVQYAIHEQQDPGGTTDFGMVTIYIDDGSGSPPAALVTAANTAVGLVKAAGVRIGVFGATTLTGNVVMTITTAVGYNHTTLVGLVQTAVSNYISGIGLEATLPYTELSHQAYLIAGVTNVSGVTLNGGTADLVPAAGQTIKPGTVAVS